MSMEKKIIAKAFMEMAEGLESGSFGVKPRIALTGMGMGNGKCMVTAPSTSPFSTISSIFLWPSSSSATCIVVMPSCSREPM